MLSPFYLAVPNTYSHPLLRDQGIDNRILHDRVFRKKRPVKTNKAITTVNGKDIPANTRLKSATGQERTDKGLTIWEFEEAKISRKKFRPAIRTPKTYWLTYAQIRSDCDLTNKKYARVLKSEQGPKHVDVEA